MYANMHECYICTSMYVCMYVCMYVLLVRANVM